MRVTDVASRRITRRMNMLGMSPNDIDSALSDPDSSITFNEPADETVVIGRRLSFEDNASKVTEDAPEPVGSHSSKRKRTSIFNDLSESKLQSAHTTASEESPTSPASTNKLKPNRQSPGSPGARGVLLGTWRDSAVPEDEKKHAVIGFIDVRDHVRTRILPNTKHGESLAEDYPLPPSPTGDWIAFERVIFSDHLVGLDRSQVKEYIRLRSGAVPEEDDGGRVAAEHAAVQEAIRRVRKNQPSENPVHPPAIAYGVHMPEHLQARVRPDNKRTRVSGHFAAINPEPPKIDPEAASITTPQQPITAQQPRFSIDPLPGTRPTRILIGCWKKSSELDPKDRHAVYGVLGQNDVFRAKVVRETRDGRLVAGNYPSGTGALWIPCEEVEFEPHLKSLNRQEVKEYCRVRQHQLDHGETSAECIENETKAVYEAQTRAGAMPYKQPDNVTVPTFTVSPQGVSDERLNGRHGYSGPELRQLRGTEPRSMETSLGEDERHPSRLQSVEAVERTRALARHEIARVEAAQGRVVHHDIHRERAVAAAAAEAANAAAVAAAAASNVSLERQCNTNGRIPFHKLEGMQRLNRAWPLQETLRLKSRSDDVKMYDSNKYERKLTGPFMGKLVSQGTIVNIDGDDYVEYRVLTKPSFF